MKIYLLGLLLLTTSLFAQRENTLSGDCVKIGPTGLCITQTEFNNLSGVTDPVQDQLDDKVDIGTDQSISGVKTFNGKIVASSTSNGFAPCPSMTEVQRNAIAAPASGDCVYNTTTLTLNVYNGTTWKSAGGGVNKWATSTSYQVDDVIIQSNKFYICLIAHTSGTFATDLAASRWLVISNDVSDSTGVLPMANGGTDKNLTPVLGGVVYTDAGSMEVLGAGTAGQVLQSNGAAAPSFVNKSVSAKTQIGSSVTLEEVQLPNNQLTETATGKYLAETGNNNLLVNPSFEHSTPSTGWTVSTTGPTAQILAEPSSNSGGAPEFGLQHARFRCDGTSGGAGTCTFLQDVPTKSTAQGLAYIRISAEQGSVVKVYAGTNGTTDLTRVLNVDASRSTPRWDGLYKIPVITGSTSTRIVVTITVTSIESPFVLADDAFVGAVDLKTDVDQSRIAGESYFAGTTNCQWTRTSATVGAFGTDTDCPGPTVVTSSMGTWLTNDSDLPRQTINNLPAGTYKATFYLPMFQTSGGVPVISINDGTTTCQGISGNTDTSFSTVVPISCTFIYSSTGNRVFEVYAGSTTNTVNIFNGQVSPQGSVKFQLQYFGSGQIYSASCGANCVNSLTAFVTDGASSTTLSLVTPSGWISGCTNPSSGQYVCSLVGFNSTPTCKLGDLSQNVIPTWITTNTTVTISMITRADSATFQDANFSITCDKTGADFIASRTIVGSFNEVMTVPNVSRPKHCSFKITGSPTLKLTTCTSSPCNVIDNIGSCVSSVTRSGAGLYALTFISGFWTSADSYNCNFDVQNWSGGTGGPAVFQGSEQTATVMNPRPFNTAAVDSAMTVNCSGF